MIQSRTTPTVHEQQNKNQHTVKQPMSELAKQIGQSKAGRRFIAQTNIYNMGDFERLDEFMRGGYYDLILMANPVERRIFDLKTTRKLHGRLKVAEVESAEEYSIKLILSTEKNDTRLRLEMVVDENYPHQVTHYSLVPVE